MKEIMNNSYFRHLSIEEKVFYLICADSCTLQMQPVSTWYSKKRLAKVLNVTMYRIGKAIASLKQKGYIQLCHDGGYDEEEGVFATTGWGITEKAIDTAIYKRANWAESKIMRDCWDITPSQYYATNTSKWRKVHLYA